MKPITELYWNVDMDEDLEQWIERTRKELSIGHTGKADHDVDVLSILPVEYKRQGWFGPMKLVKVQVFFIWTKL